MHHYTSAKSLLGCLSLFINFLVFFLYPFPSLPLLVTISTFTEFLFEHKNVDFFLPPSHYIQYFTSCFCHIIHCGVISRSSKDCVVYYKEWKHEHDILPESLGSCARLRELWRTMGIWKGGTTFWTGKLIFFKAVNNHASEDNSYTTVFNPTS